MDSSCLTAYFGFHDQSRQIGLKTASLGSSESRDCPSVCCQGMQYASAMPVVRLSASVVTSAYAS